MNILDENVPRDQAELLKQWGFQFRSISRDLGYQGIGDDDIRPLLLRLKKPTLLSRDSDFFLRDLVHVRYCLAWFDVMVDETTFFIRRFLRHSRFQSSAQRLGKVIRVRSSNIQYWTRNAEKLVDVEWSSGEPL